MSSQDWRSGRLACKAVLLSLALFSATAIGCATNPNSGASEAAFDSRLIAFRSDTELRSYLRRYVRERRKQSRTHEKLSGQGPITGSLVAASQAFETPPIACTQREGADEDDANTSPCNLWREMPEEVLITGSLIRGAAAVGVPVTNITNNQEAGVDEGDIVKLHGNTLIILRRGRLFTVSIARGKIQPIDSIDAFPPGADARYDWYDEMLVAGNRVVVIGYSYQREGTQINRFKIDRQGRLTFEDAYQVRSGDYYSSRNYASRLVGNKLVFYTPLYLPWEANDPLEVLPGMRKWNGIGAEPAFERISSSRHVYVPAALREDKDVDARILHTVTSCDLVARVIDCDATSVVGSFGRSFYVSGSAVYIWVTDEWRDWRDERPVAAHLYRMPLDGSRPSAIGVRGAPEDQFSFHEDEKDKTLNVLVRAQNAGDAFWAAVALLRIPLASFAEGREIESPRYRSLPTPPRQEYWFHNRFVGDYVLYGTGNGYGGPIERDATLVAVPIHGGEISQLSLPHGIDRIEVLGEDALVVGSDDNNVYFSTIDLSSLGEPIMGDRYVYADAAQAETRSHAFFYQPDDGGAGSGDSGILGLPVARPAREAFRQLFEDSAALVFIKRANKQFKPLGELPAQTEGVVDDNCQASCVDWYGNARPIFINERVFALLGYELVEGTVTRASIHEIGRVSFAPAATKHAAK